MSDLALTWLLEETTISGTAHTTLALADAMARRGHRVRIVTTGLPLTWRASLAEWAYVDRLEEYDARSDDFVIATSWTTLTPAQGLGCSRVLHLCLGDESALEENEAVRPYVEAAYALPVPRLVPNEAVAAAMARFSTDLVPVGTVVDDGIFRDRIPARNDPPRVLLCGHARTAAHGLEYGYGAAAHARWFHQTFDLVRLSAWAPAREEPADAVQEFHVALTTAEAARLVHSCDVLVAPNLREEGLGLAAAEAMAAGLACVLTDVPAHRGLAGAPDAALFAPEANAVELGERLIELLSDAALHDRLRIGGRRLAEGWRSAPAAERLEQALRSRLS